MPEAKFDSMEIKGIVSLGCVNPNHLWILEGGKKGFGVAIPEACLDVKLEVLLTEHLKVSGISIPEKSEIIIRLPKYWQARVKIIEEED